MATKHILHTAYERGRFGLTFATAFELRTPSYDLAYQLGQEYAEGRVVEPHTLMGCGCPRCRLERIVTQAQVAQVEADAVLLRRAIDHARRAHPSHNSWDRVRELEDAVAHQLVALTDDHTARQCTRYCADLLGYVPTERE